MSWLNPLNWFKKDEPSSSYAPLSPGAVAPIYPDGKPSESYAGRRRRRGGKTLKAGQKAGRRHKKHSRRA